MGNSNSYILIFQSHNQAIVLYKNLLNKNYKVELVATPCNISSGCSQALKFKGEYMSEIINEARKNKIGVNGIYKIIKKGEKSFYERV